jgi:hypothetical protein
MPPVVVSLLSAFRAAAVVACVGALCLSSAALAQDRAEVPAPQPAPRPAQQPNKPPKQPPAAGSSQPQLPPGTVEEEVPMDPEAPASDRGEQAPPPAPEGHYHGERSPPPPGAYPPGPPSYPPHYPPPPGYGYAPVRPIPEPPPPPMERRSPGMMAAGIVLISLGAVALVAGAVVINDAQDDCVLEVGNDFCNEVVDERRQTAGIIVAVTGVAMLGAGIPLTIVGSRRVPAEPPTGENGSALPRVRLGAGMPPLESDPAPLERRLGGARLTWAF